MMNFNAVYKNGYAENFDATAEGFHYAMAGNVGLTWLFDRFTGEILFCAVNKYVAPALAAFARSEDISALLANC